YRFEGRERGRRRVAALPWARARIPPRALLHRARAARPLSPRALLLRALPGRGPAPWRGRGSAASGGSRRAREPLRHAARPGACGQVEAIGYAADPERLKLDLAAYRSIIGPDRKLSVIMRPMAPDCESADNLARKLEVARAAGCVEAGFYHYGFMRLESLDLIREASGASDHPTC